VDFPHAGLPQALIVVPTAGNWQYRLQPTSDRAGANWEFAFLVFMAVAYEPQVEALAKGVEVVVGTPGRLLD
jgi:superfamily II DNA/RNA helicase